MSAQQEEVVRRLFDEVFTQGNLDLVNELIAPDHINNDPVNPIRGRDAYRDLVVKYRTAFPDLRLEVDEIFSAGDRVVCRYHGTGTQRGELEGIAPTGREANVPGIFITRIADGQLQESWINWDALGLMQQLGVVTLPGKAAEAGA